MQFLQVDLIFYFTDMRFMPNLMRRSRCHALSVAATEKRPEVKVLSVSFDPSSIRSDDDLFPSSVFADAPSAKKSEEPSSEEREVNIGSNNIDVVPNFGLAEADEEETEFSNPFAGMSEVSNYI